MVNWKVKAKCTKCGWKAWSPGTYYWDGRVAPEFIEYQKKLLREAHPCSARLKYELIPLY